MVTKEGKTKGTVLLSFDATDTEYVWSNGNLVAEKEQNGTTAIYNYGIDGIATRKKAGNTEYYVKNIHGNFIVITNTASAMWHLPKQKQ